MIHRIFELKRPEILKRTEHVGYREIKTTEPITLQEIGEYSYSSKDEAETWIHHNKEELTHKELIILPVFQIDWNGEIRS